MSLPPPGGGGMYTSLAVFFLSTAPLGVATFFDPGTPNSLSKSSPVGSSTFEGFSGDFATTVPSEELPSDEARLEPEECDPPPRDRLPEPEDPVDSDLGGASDFAA